MFSLAHTALAGAAAATLLSAAPPPAPPAPPLPPPSLPAGTEVALPFAPPLDRALRYSLITTSAGDETPSKQSFVEITLTFRARPGGFLLTAVHDVPGLSAAQRRDPNLQLLFRPVTLRLDPDGALVGMEDEAGYWRSIEGLFANGALGPNPDPRGVRVVQETLRAMRAMPDDERLELVTRNFNPVLAAAGLRMRVGEAQVLEDRAAPPPIPGVDGPGLLREGELRLVRADGERAHYRQTTAIPARDLEVMVMGLTRLAPADKRPKSFRVISATQDYQWFASTRTGLTELYTEAVRLEADEDGRRKVLTRERKLRLLASR